jgi:hypothetical protein
MPILSILPMSYPELVWDVMPLVAGIEQRFSLQHLLRSLRRNILSAALAQAVTNLLDSYI